MDDLKGMAVVLVTWIIVFILVATISAAIQMPISIAGILFLSLLIPTAFKALDFAQWRGWIS